MGHTLFCDLELILLFTLFYFGQSQKPKPVLRVSRWWLSPGSSVTLSCEVEHESAGWSFYWYKAVPDLSHKSASYSYELLPASSNGTADNSYIIHGQTHTAGYVCRAGRGEPHVYTLYSQPHFVWSGDLHPSASLSVSPDRVQHFTSDSVSLTCEGNSAEWRVGRFLFDEELTFCSGWGKMNGSTCHAGELWSSTGVYWCESGSAFSNAVNITGQYDDLILLSPVHPVTEGHSLTLGCKSRTENLLSKVVFYQNDKLIQNDSRVEMIIPAVSKSHEGFYKCQSSGKESPQSWLTVKSSTSDHSSLPVWFLTILVCIILLLIFLILFLYKKSKDSPRIRLQDSNQDSVTAQENHYASLDHGDMFPYESLKRFKQTENNTANENEADSGHYEHLRSLEKTENKRGYENAADSGHYEYLRSLEKTENKRGYENAADSGHYEHLRRGHENAADSGHYEYLRRGHENADFSFLYEPMKYIKPTENEASYENNIKEV